MSNLVFESQAQKVSAFGNTSSIFLLKTIGNSIINIGKLVAIMYR